VSAAVRKSRALNLRGVGFALVGLAGLWVGVQGADYRPFGAGVALFGFFLAASFLGRAGRIAAALRPIVGRTVRVEVWGTPVPAPHGGLWDVSTVTGFGAGLLFHLLPESGDAGGILKVAQPGEEMLGDERIEIATAAYVQWAGRRLERPPGTTAPALALRMP
jgi:hypothetical protein